MFNRVDKDSNNLLEFSEFLEAIALKNGDEHAQALTTFFQNLTNGYYDTKGLCFSNWVLKERRQHLLNAIVLQDEEDKRR